MALSEGLNGFVNFIKNSFKDGDEDVFEGLNNYSEDSYEEESVDRNLALDTMYDNNYATKPTRSFDRESKVTTLPNNNTAYKTGEVAIIEPRSFSEAAQIVKKLMEKKTVVLHLDLLDKEQSQRTIDFVCGAAYALNGKPQKVSDMVFIFTPSNIALSVENSTVQNKFAESLWNKPL